MTIRNQGSPQNRSRDEEGKFTGSSSSRSSSSGSSSSGSGLGRGWHGDPEGHAEAGRKGGLASHSGARRRSQ